MRLLAQAHLATVAQQTLPIAHSMAQQASTTVTAPRPRSSSPQTAETGRNAKSHSPEKDEKETPIRVASQPARRIRGKSKGPTISDYTETPGQSSSGPATAAELARGRQPERDFKNLAVSTIMKQVSITQLRNLLKERGEYTDALMSKEHLSTMLKDCLLYTSPSPRD